VGTFSRTWSYIQVSWRVLMKDTSILVFPVVSMAAVLVILVPFAIGNRAALVAAKGSSAMLPASLYAQTFVLYLVCSFVIVFANSAMVACASICLSGGTAAVADGFSAALRNLPRIALWSMIAGTVGFLLSMARRREDGLVNQLVTSVIGVSWAAATYFIIPIVILEGCDIFTAFKRSAELFRRQWGAAVAGNVGFGAIFMLFWIVPIALVGAVASLGVLTKAAILPTLVACGIYFVILGAVQSALEEIFVVVAYQQASGNEDVQEISPQFPTTGFSQGELRIND